jgi:cytochrome c-type biogenesis protein CcmE
MSMKLLKIVLTVVVVGGGLGLLVAQSLGENLEYYKQVDEVMASPAAWKGKRLKLGGHVLKGSIFNKQGTLEYVFTVERNGKSVQVHYTGIVPDTFKDDAEVVVAGKLGDDGVFEAHEVIAKCPSKYEAARKAGRSHPGEIPMKRDS